VLQTLELETDAADSVVIWLHGLGAMATTSSDRAGAGPARRAGRRFVSARPMQPVTINGGAVMRAWYDVYALEGVRREDARASAPRRRASRS